MGKRKKNALQNMTKEELSFDAMKKVVIDKTKGLLYQYRACRRDTTTIYDIENIRNGVVYARTPLKMNDPFDSQISFSTTKVYEDIISQVLDRLAMDQNLKTLMFYMLKYKLLGKMIDLITTIGELKNFFQKQQKILHKGHLSIEEFISTYFKELYSKCPLEIKKVVDFNAYYAFTVLLLKLGEVEITEKNINEILKFEDALDELQKKIVEIKDGIYLPQFENFLSKLTISCFSASGWENALMWSHYANSYSGICVEYDFNKMEDKIGLLFPVEYAQKRPTLLLKDFGIEIKEKEDQSPKIDLQMLVKYLLVKDKCWKYEEEWRIINIGEPNTPKFIEVPFIESVTFGVNIEPICKTLLLDICKDKGIKCYNLVLSEEDFSMTRELIEENDYVFDFNEELGYISLMQQKIEEDSVKQNKYMDKQKEFIKEGIVDVSVLISVLESAIDVLCDMYFYKLSMNRICSKTPDLTSKDIPQELKEFAVKIKDYIGSCDVIIKATEKAVFDLSVKRQITKLNYAKSIKLCDDIKILSSKVEGIEWHQFMTMG